jgi:cytochrome c oxidase cbb3-type subunit 3
MMTRICCAALPLLALLCCSCERETRAFHPLAPAASNVEWTRLTDFQPGVGAPVSPQPGAGKNEYEHNAQALSEGKRLYASYNCLGCHANGGGDIGPPLMDNTWIYGDEPAQVFATIVEGRPNGMPSFGGRIPEHQLWELVAYVRSMSGVTPMDAAPGRNDDMQAAPAENSADPAPPVESNAPGPGETAQ